MWGYCLFLVYKMIDESAKPSISCDTGIFAALLFRERGRIMTLVPDTWGANRNPAPKMVKMYKTLTATATSGSAVTDTGNFFTKDCPFPVRIVGFEVQCISVSGDGFSGSGSNLTVALQSSNEIDVSPASPTAVVWDTVVTIDASGSVSDTDKMLFDAPSNVSGLLNPSMDQTYVNVPKGGSLRTTLSAQARDSLGASTTPVELLAIVSCMPVDVNDKIHF